MKFRIKHISFLFEGERQVVKCSINGRFLVKGRYMGYSNTVGPQCALDFVRLPVIKDSDPVLNLTDGRKVRVYLGGDSSHIVVEAHSIIEVHDAEALKFQKDKKKSSKEKAPKSQGMQGMFTDPDIFEDLQGW